MSQRHEVTKVVLDLDYWLAVQLLDARRNLPDDERELIRKQFMVAIRNYLGPIPRDGLIPPSKTDDRVRFAFECQSAWCGARVSMLIDPESQLANGIVHPTCPGCLGPLQVLPRKIMCPTCQGHGRLCVSDYLDITTLCWRCHGAREIDRE